MGKYWYAEKNNYGLSFTLDSIGWQVLRFKSKQARNSYVDTYCYRLDTGNWVCREIGYRRMRDHLGYGKITWCADDSDYLYEIGIKGPGNE